MAEITTARSKQAAEDVDRYRECVFAAAAGDDYDALDIADICDRRQWSDVTLASDISAAKDDLNSRDFESGFHTELERLNKLVVEFPQSTIPVSVGLIDGLIRRMQNPQDYAGRPIHMPPEIIAARAKMSDNGYRLGEHNMRLATLKQFRLLNPRLFHHDRASRSITVSRASAGRGFAVA